MILLAVVVVVALAICFIPFRIFIMHPFKTVKYAFIDLYRYFHDRKHKIYDGGILNAYCAHFGGGKTLSVVEYVTFLFRKYNNQRVYDRKKKKWLLQKVNILSNVDLIGVPFMHLDSLRQVVECAKYNADIDEQEGTRTVTLVVLDEASSEMNSRSFKDNIDPAFLNTLITCRHYHTSMFYTSQKFHLTDKLLRSVTQNVIWCEKRWRFMIQYFYDADEMENCTDPKLIKPFKRFGFLIEDKIFNSYDTLACVDKLEKKVSEGDMMTEQEILELRGEINPNIDFVTPSKKLRKRMRKK